MITVRHDRPSRVQLPLLAITVVFAAILLAGEPVTAQRIVADPATGDYLVKRRRGETTEVLVDWTPHAAVRRVANEGDEPENTLAVEVLEGRTSFLVNGTEVHHMPSPQARPYGVAGIRANHRLDILVRDWSLGAIPPATSTP